MNISLYITCCLCVGWMTPCAYTATTTAAASISTASTTTSPPSTTQNHTTLMTNATSAGSTSSPTSAGSLIETNSTDDNNTSTSSTAPSTTPMTVHCMNGTCSGNDSSCLNGSIADTCDLSPSQTCYQIVFENTTDTYYDAGCSNTCEFLIEEASNIVTRTTRCCDTNMCNSKLLSDPDSDGSGTLTTSVVAVLFLSIVCLLIQ